MTLREAAQQALEFADDIVRGKYKGNAEEIRDALRAALSEQSLTTTEPELNNQLDKLAALELIASPMRPDGTWNRDREACRQLAADALSAQPEPAAPTVVEPCGWACFQDGVMQTELVGTKADVDFWCASDEPHMQGMVAGPVFATPPRAALTVDQAIYALSSALAESKGWLRDYSDGVIRTAIDRRDDRTALTDEELERMYNAHASYQECGPLISGWFDFARAIEAAHGIKEQT